MNKKAFTLVELITVTSIIALLGTIGYIMLQGHIGFARDSKRISELSEIKNGLHFYLSKNLVYPEPSARTINIGSGAMDLIVQGYLGLDILKSTRMLGNLSDPLDNIYYTYAVNSTKTRFQLLTLLENNPNLNLHNNFSLVSNIYASYGNRYPYSIGNIVGIFLDETNTPVQELTLTGVNLETDNSNYKVLFGNRPTDTITLSGADLYNEIIFRIEESLIIE